MDATPCMAVDRLYALSADTLIRDSLAPSELGKVIPAHPSDAPVRTLLAYQKDVSDERAPRDAIHLQARGGQRVSQSGM